jgi:hypothetical protein
LYQGVNALQISPFAGSIIPNSGSVISQGEEFTDTPTSWVKKGFVAGPFFYPPMEHFCVNTILAGWTKLKVHTIMDLSIPNGWKKLAKSKDLLGTHPKKNKNGKPL